MSDETELQAALNAATNVKPADVCTSAGLDCQAFLFVRPWRPQELTILEIRLIASTFSRVSPAVAGGAYGVIAAPRGLSVPIGHTFRSQRRVFPI
jgi:hypothetical protein